MEAQHLAAENASQNYGSRESENPEDSPSTDYKVYTRRWIMLAIFCSYSASNAYQWNQYATISDIMIKFYDQSAMTIDLLTITYLVVYFIFILPVNWFLDKYGLRPTAIVAAGFNAAAAWIKLTSTSPNRFWVLFFGQVVAALSQVCLLGIPAQQAAVWFGAKEVAMATALGVVGNQLGIALGFLLPPWFVDKPDPWDPIAVENDLKTMTYVTAFFTMAQFVLVLIAYDERPPTPPSRAQAVASSEGQREAPMQTLKTLFSQTSFVLLLVSYGLNTGAFYTITTVLNNVVIAYYEDAQEDVGYIGLLIIFAGMAGSLIIGYWLDKTHRYRWTTVFVYAMSFLGTVAFTLSLVIGKPDHIWLLYLTAGVMGLFMTGYLPLGFEFAAEITYPISEGMTSGLLNASAQGLGTVLILAVQMLIDKEKIFDKDGLSGLLLLCLLLLIGLILTVFIKEEKKRQQTESFEPEDSQPEINYNAI